MAISGYAKALAQSVIALHSVQHHKALKEVVSAISVLTEFLVCPSERVIKHVSDSIKNIISICVTREYIQIELKALLDSDAELDLDRMNFNEDEDAPMSQNLSTLEKLIITVKYLISNRFQKVYYYVLPIMQAFLPQIEPL